VFWSTTYDIWATASMWLLGAGIIMALVAAIFGFADFIGDNRIRVSRRRGEAPLRVLRRCKSSLESGADFGSVDIAQRTTLANFGPVVRGLCESLQRWLTALDASCQYRLRALNCDFRNITSAKGHKCKRSSAGPHR
jgi:hypothetical protein